MKKTLFTLIFTSFSFFAMSQQKAQEHPIDKKLKACLGTDENYTTAGSINCISIGSDEWDKELNKYYKLLMTVLTADEKNTLKEAQRKWIEFRDKEFQFSGTVHANLEGTMWKIAAAEREYQIVRQRALDLKDYNETIRENR